MILLNWNNVSVVSLTCANIWRRSLLQYLSSLRLFLELPLELDHGDSAFWICGFPIILRVFLHWSFCDIFLASSHFRYTRRLGKKRVSLGFSICFACYLILIPSWIAKAMFLFLVVVLISALLSLETVLLWCVRC